MAPIVIIGSACSFVRNHWCSQRIFRGTAHAKRGAICRLLQTLEHLRTDAVGGLVYGKVTQIKYPIGVIGSVFVAQAQPTLSDWADPAPFLVCDLNYIGHNLLRRNISCIAHRSNILIFQLRLSRLELPD